MEQKQYLKNKLPAFSGTACTMERQVPLTVILSVLFMNIWGYMGLSFTGIGMIFCVVFTPLIDFVSPFAFGNNTEITGGVVTDVNPTNISVNEKTVVEYRFFFTYTGKTYKGISYSTEHNCKAEQSVPVEFKPDDPSVARIKGMDLKPVGLFALFIYIFPAIGLSFLFLAIKRGIPAIKALKCGLITRGTFVRMESTGGSINNQTIFDVYFTFKDITGREYTAKGSTHKTWLVQDEPEERIIYDPGDPANAVVIDAMPSAVKKFLSSIPG